MAQFRTFEFQSDDTTKSLNEWLLGIIPSGLYCGFDEIEIRNDMQLNLLHTFTSFNFDSKNKGIYISKSGVRIIEDTQVVVGLVSPTTFGQRIDLIVATHTYSLVAGGSPALYSIIEGIESNSPVAPIVVNNQIVIGELYLPQNCSSLNNVDVKYTRAKTPLLANDFYYLNKKANLDDNNKIIISQIPVEINKTFIYEDITDRNLDTNVWLGKRCLVKNAVGDSQILSGKAFYIYDSSGWILENADSIQWTNVNYENTWEDFFNSDLGLKIRKIGDRIEFRGSCQVKNSASLPLTNFVVATLPVWARIQTTVGGSLFLSHQPSFQTRTTDNLIGIQSRLFISNSENTNILPTLNFSFFNENSSGDLFNNVSKRVIVNMTGVCYYSE